MNKVLVCGSLCNVDLAVAELLSRFNIHTIILRYESERIQEVTVLPGALDFFSLDNIVYVKDQREAIPYLCSAKVIVSLTGAVDKFLRFRHFFLRNFWILPKTINITTGSDITELVRLKSREGKHYISYLNRTMMNYVNPYPEVIQTLKKVKIKNYQIMKSPYYLVSPWIDTDKSKENGISYLHASNLDWGEADNKYYRNSTKGNDRFIKAFIRAIKSGANITCTMIDRGPDRELAKKMIQQSGCEERFKFVGQLNQHQLLELIIKHDVIVDQFDVGAVGGIAVEAMAQKKPVMIYINKDCWPLAYSEEPPVINCHTEEEIYNAIQVNVDKKSLQLLGEKAERWVRKYHDVHTADFSEFILKVCLAMELEWPRENAAKT